MPESREIDKDYHKATEGNYDLLRIISAIAVIIIHVSGLYKGAYTNEEDTYRIHIVNTLLYNTLARFAVPSFMMLSGAFLLDNNKNKEYKYFYKKTVSKIVVPTIVFSLIYLLYSLLLSVASSFTKGGNYTSLLSPIKSLIIGEPFYHMWYLYTLIGVYVLIPVLIRIKAEIGEVAFAKVSWIYFVIASISGFTSTNLLHWSISKVVLYLGYVMIGYQLRKKAKNNKSAIKAVVFCTMAIIILLMLTYIQYRRTTMGYSEKDEKYSIVGNFNPLVVIASTLLFAGFSNMTIKSSFLQKLSGDTFLIYLFHAGVWQFISLCVFKSLSTKPDPIYMIPVSVVVTFIISLILARLYNKIWAVIESKHKLSERLCRVFHL